MRRDKELWKPVFANGNCFTITAGEFLDQIIVNFNESQLRRDAEFNTYKFFSDVIESMDNGGTFLFFISDREYDKSRSLYNKFKIK